VEAAAGVPVAETIVVPAHRIRAAQERLFGRVGSLRRAGAEAPRPPGPTVAVPRPAAREPVTLEAPPERGLPTLVLKLLLLGGIGFVVWALYLVQEVLWQQGRRPESQLEHAVALLGYAWALPIVPAVCALAGFMLYRKPRYGRRVLEPLETLVSFRVVARGENAFRLRSTIESIRAELARLPLFPYVIEVVTDLPVDLGNGDELAHYVVPGDYRTGRDARFKARALAYAMDESKLPDDAWIVHLDEESHLTPSVVVGIHDAVREEEESGEHRVGQGAILYHRDLHRRPFLTLADSIRTGDDVGRFYLQHRLGVTVFGLHGSFILVRCNVEREVGFDFGPEGSITEDSFWALAQMQLERRCRWVDGYVAEQAPQNVNDFVKQRRRWFVGLAKVVTDAPVGLRWRLPLAVSTAIWSASWIGILYLYVNLFTGFAVPDWVQLCGNVAFATFIATYVVGLRLNLENLPPQGRLRTAGLYAAQVALIPAFAALEAAGVIYGLVRPETGFHVIRK
jgi:egghead protein (zeste-white 4 protein)